jgi:hypothetical protein
MAETNLWRFRELVLNLRDDAPPGWGEERLQLMLERYPAAVAELHDVGRAESHQRKTGGMQEMLWDLYALSRLTDILIAPHQPVNNDPALLDWTTGQPWWTGSLPTTTAWSAFCNAIGATTIAENAFHPFFHEIVAVRPSDDPDQAPGIIAEHWPGALINSLLLARAGVTVQAGSNWMDPIVASQSWLYWAWWRRNRVARDLSHGWGQNSQWRTEFRRDYVVGDELHYNVDGILTTTTPQKEGWNLPSADRLVLLRYRHSLSIDLGEQWPYDDTHVERRV